MPLRSVPYRRRRYVRMPAITPSYVQTKKNMRQIAKNVMNRYLEPKWFELTSNIASVDRTPFIDSFPNEIIQGDDYYEREGLEIAVTSIQVNLFGYIITHTSQPITYQVWLWRDKIPNGSLPTADELMTGYGNATAMVNPKYKSRYQILKKLEGVLHCCDIATEELGNKGAFRKNLYIKFKKPLKVIFDSGSTDYSDLVKNGLGLIATCNHDNGYYLKYHWRINFHEK